MVFDAADVERHALPVPGERARAEGAGGAMGDRGRELPCRHRRLLGIETRPYGSAVELDLDPIPGPPLPAGGAEDGEGGRSGAVAVVLADLQFPRGTGAGTLVELDPDAGKVGTGLAQPAGEAEGPQPVEPGIRMIPADKAAVDPVAAGMHPVAMIALDAIGDETGEIAPPRPAGRCSIHV